MNAIAAKNTLEVGSIVIGLFGGLAIFLFGMEQMTDAMKIVAGEKMKGLLARITTNRFKAVSAGAFVTAVIQSSSVTTVLTVGFVSAGLLNLSQSVGIIMGANIGTTVTAQIIAFKVTKYALVLISVGFALLFLSKRKKVKQYGLMIMGLGLIFFGMNLMSEATYPLRSYEPFINVMGHMNNPLTAIAISALFTGVVQSSSATTGIIIVLAGQGFITLETGIALAFGANLGTCVTAILASLGKPREAVQVALVHVLFNVMGVVIWIGFISQLAALVRMFSPATPNLIGAARLAADTPRQIANAHTIFNVTNTFVFIWLAQPLARLVRYLVPERVGTEPGILEPKYLDENLLETPDLALERVRLELSRLGRHTQTMVQDALETVFFGTQEDLDRLEKMDDEIDSLYDGIVAYLAQLSREDLLRPQAKQLSKFMAIANDIENIGDMIQTNLVEAGNARLEHAVEMSDETQGILRSLHEKVFWAVEHSLEALNSSDKKIAREVREAKAEINQLAGKADTHLSRRLTAAEPNRLILFRIESEIIEYLKRVYYFAKRIARVTEEVEKLGRNIERKYDSGHTVKSTA